MEDGQSHLLLVDGPHIDSRSGYEERYRYILKHVLVKLSRSADSSLDIAVYCARLNADESLKFSFIQGMLAKLYGVVCDVFFDHDIGPASSNYVNVRIFAVAKWIDEGNSSDLPQLRFGLAKDQLKQAGPVFTERMLANAGRQWASLTYDTQGSSYKLVQDLTESGYFIKGRLAKMQVDELSNSIASHQDSDEYNSKDQVRLYNSVIVGGTFDNLHEGHKLLLSATALVLNLNAASQSIQQRLIVGITGEDLLKNKKYIEMLESWEDRQKGVFKFLSSILSLTDSDASVEPERRNDPGPNGKACIYHLPNGPTVECVEIQDPYGPTITEELIDALVVSEETRAGGAAVNEKRTEKGWAPLEVFEVDVLSPKDSSDIKDKISSTEKRRKLYEAQVKAS